MRTCRNKTVDKTKRTSVFMWHSVSFATLGYRAGSRGCRLNAGRLCRGKTEWWSCCRFSLWPPGPHLSSSGGEEKTVKDADRSVCATNQFILKEQFTVLNSRHLSFSVKRSTDAGLFCFLLNRSVPSEQNRFDFNMTAEQMLEVN